MRRKAFLEGNKKLNTSTASSRITTTEQKSKEIKTRRE